MKSSITFLSLFLLVTFSFAQRDFSEVKVEATKVKNNVYMLTGSGGNIGVVTGKDGVVMIDNQFAPLADKIKEAIKGIGGDDVTYMINTHFHGDHTGGNAVFGGDGAMVVAHDNVRKRLSTEQKRANGDVVAPQPQEAWPIVTFEQQVKFYLNDEEIELIHADRAHTDGDVVVFFRKANVIHTGDVFVTYGYPFIDASSGASITGMINFLDQVIEAIDEETIVIPGHGPLSRKKDVIAFRDRLQDILDKVLVQKRKGKTIEEIIEMKITQEYDEEWGGGFIKAKDFLLLLDESLSEK